MEKATFTQKLALLLMASTLLCGGVSAQVRLQKAEAAAQLKLPKPTAAVAENAPASFKAGLVAKAKSTTSDILIEEDFSNFTAGEPGNPDTTNILASYYGDPGPYIADGYMQQDGWSGTYVYQSGGKCSLVPPTLQTPACLNTPLGDYSGHIKVTLRARALPCEGTGSTLGISAAKGGLTNADYADTDADGTGYETRFYVKQGWAEVEYEFDNYSADNDGYICIYTSGSIEIDDVKITTTPTFIAPPKVLDPTNFTKTSFTINWQPVRKAFSYWIDLYKKTYLSKEDAIYIADFDGSDPLNDSKFSFALGEQSGVKEGVGQDGSKGLAAYNGDSITSPTSELSKMRDMKFYMQVVEPSAESEYDYTGYIYLDLLTEDGWDEYGAFYADMFSDGYAVSLDDEFYGDFKNQYLRVRLRIDGLPDDGYVVFDNIEATVAPEARMDTVEGELLGYFYAVADGDQTSYTFTHLDPEGDYYYTIKSHYVSQFSDPIMYHALGLSTPELNVATDIDASGSYTANFKPSPKATGYVVRNYGVTTVESDGWVDIMNETFSNIDNNITSNDDPYNPDALDNYYDATQLDEYTDTPGWTGIATSLSQGCLGCQDANFLNSSLTTPPLYLANSDTFRFDILAYGNAGSTLTVNIGGRTMELEFQSADGSAKGVVNASVVLAETGKSVKIKFYTADCTPFVIDYLDIMQELKKGDRVYTWLSEQELDAETTSASFSALDTDLYSEFAYNVTAEIEMDDESALSDTSDFMLVNLQSGTSTNNLTGVRQPASNATVVARYSIDGMLLQKPAKGINIVKMSDGRTVKEIVK